MLDQSFSAENFRSIFDHENRKGNYLEGEFFPEVEVISKEIKTCVSEIREHLKKKSIFTKIEFELVLSLLNDKKKRLKDKKELLLSKELEKISIDLTKNNFQFSMDKIELGNGKSAYSIDKSPSSYFMLKKLQSNIRRLYKVKQANRYNVVCQIRDIISDKLPKYIIKTDVSSFYESILRSSLLKKINDDHLLTVTSRNIIKRILYEYGRVSLETEGLPRGVGISAYLSEIYMREIDELIKSRESVVYYARYVDDIIIIYAPNKNADISSELFEIKEILLRDGLTQNPQKTRDYHLGKDKSKKFEYLGYVFSYNSGVVSLGMTTRKIQKYKERIDFSFLEYKNNSFYNEKKSRKLLIKRIRFLTGNTRLFNNKKNVFVGIYFSNSLLTDMSGLIGLDQYMQVKINEINSVPLRNRLSSLSFSDGFSEKRFHNFSEKDLKNIVGAWKHVA